MRTLFALAVVMAVSAMVPTVRAGEPEAMAARQEAEAERIRAFAAINGSVSNDWVSVTDLIETQQQNIGTLRGLLVDAIAGQAISQEDATEAALLLDSAEFNLSGVHPQIMNAIEGEEAAQQNYSAGLQKQAQAVTAYNAANYSLCVTRAEEADERFVWAQDWVQYTVSFCLANSWTDAAAADSLIPGN